MNRRYLLSIGFALVAVIVCCVARTTALAADTKTAPTERVFELRTYTCEPRMLNALLTRFRDHTVALFEKHGIENIAYWTPADEPRSKDTLIYVVAHPSREAAKKNWEAFVNDPVWQKARDESEANGKIVSKIESVYLNATDFSPLK